MKISPARTAAFDVLLAIEKEKAFSSVLLPAVEESLSLEDRGLCHQLVLGSLRKQIYLDRLITALSKGRRVDDEVRIALRMAIFQLKFLDRIPDHSAVNESVNLVHRAKKSSARPFVNAILRRLLREDVELNYEDELDRLSVETSHPPWLLEKWMADFGADTTRRIAVANNKTPPTVFRLLTDEQEVRGYASAHARASALVPGCYLSENNEHLVKLARQGRIYFQDEGSQMVALSVEVRSKSRILDVCASPGGKTGMIASKAQENAAVVVAGDITKRRIDLLVQNSIRQKAKLTGVIQFDATSGLPFGESSFESVLVDAPCSGTGTIRHNPELRYMVGSGDLNRFADKQLSILRSASEMVRRGGQLVYSTCSLEKEENEEICERFLTENKDYRPVRPGVPPQFLTSDGYARTRPDRDQMDGFFVADLRRL